MITKTAEELQHFGVRALMAAGADRENAEITTEHLVRACLSGVDSHGIQHLPGYVVDIQKGWIAAKAKPAILKETPSSALVTGRWTFGQVAAKWAMEVGIRKARQHDVAVVGLVQCHHIGRLGHFTEMAAAEGMASWVWSGGYAEQGASSAPYGAKKPVLHTNPISWGFPTSGEPVMADFATTSVAGMKIVVARRRGEQLPPGCIIDKEGNPTTDPDKFFDGGMHVAFGGHKGYAIQVASEFLSHILVGSEKYAEAGFDSPILAKQGVSMFVFKADLFRPMAELLESGDEMLARLHAVPPAPGFKEVLAPGDMESRARAVREREGIPMPDDILKPLNEMAVALKIPTL